MEEEKWRRRLGIPCTTSRRRAYQSTRLKPKQRDDEPASAVTERMGHLLLQLFGQLHHLRGQGHAGLHHHQVPGAQGVAMALSALGGLLPGVVVHGNICSIFNQCLLENAKARVIPGPPWQHLLNDCNRKVNGTFPVNPKPVTRAQSSLWEQARGTVTCRPWRTCRSRYRTLPSETQMGARANATASDPTQPPRRCTGQA